MRSLMQWNRSVWTWSVLGMAPLALLVTCPLRGAAGPPPPLPQGLVTAWQEAGATVGWMRPDRYGYFSFLAEHEGKARDLPAFRFSSWREGLLAKLPAPEAGFGLDLRGTQVTDAGLKALAGLKHLQAL